MTAVGFEPTKHYAQELKSCPFDRSGTLSDFSLRWFHIIGTRYLIVVLAGLEPATSAL